MTYRTELSSTVVQLCCRALSRTTRTTKLLRCTADAYDPFRGFLRTVDTYVIGAFNDEGHIKIILFNWFLCGVTALVQRGGGAQVCTRMAAR